MSDGDIAGMIARIKRERGHEHAIQNVATGPSNVGGMGWAGESALDISRQTLAPMFWDIESLLPTNDAPGILFGPPGGLKTWLALHLAGCVVNGGSFLGRYQVRQRNKAVYLNLDAGRLTLARRVQRLGLDSAALEIISPDAWDAAAFRELASRCRGAFVVLDCFADIHREGRDDPAEAMRRTLRDLRHVYERNDLGGLLLDHAHRPREGGTSDYYGSVQKQATARTMWKLEPITSGEQNVARAKITSRKMSEGEPFPPFIAEITFGERVMFRANSESPQAIVESDVSVALAAIARRGRPMSRSEIAKESGMSDARVREAVKDPRLVIIGRGRATQYGLGNRYESSFPLGDETIRYDSDERDAAGLLNEENRDTAGRVIDL